MLGYAGESNMKRVSLECGGKSPHVVLADADLATAAEAIAWGIYYNAGETCNAGSRVIVHASVKDELLAGIARVAKTITLGNPFDPATQMGALIDQGHMQRVLGYVDIGVAEGARVALGGRRPWPRAAATMSSTPFLTGCVRRCGCRARRSSGRFSP